MSAYELFQKQMSTILSDMDGALSRAPCAYPSEEEKAQHETEAFVHWIIQGIPASDKKPTQIHQYQAISVCREVAIYSYRGWPEKKDVPEIVKPYFSVAGA